MVTSGVIGVITMVLWLVSGKRVGAEVYHLVGGDRGWDPSSDLAAWSSSRIFRVGDNVWFTYSRAEGKIAELKTKEEYEACDATNPIQMYTNGLDSINLDEEGIRYFVSSNSNHCKNGLKLHVKVLPEAMASNTPKVFTSESAALAYAAPAPSGSNHLSTTCVFSVAGALLFYSVIMNV